MSPWRRHFRALAEASEPPSELSSRLVRRLAWPRLLARATAAEPAPEATARLLRRVRSSRRPDPRPRRAAAVLVLIAAAFLIFLRLVPEPTPLDQALSTTVPITESLTAEVRADYTGTGRVQGTTAAPRIRWEVGTLALDVAPHQGIDLSVDTDEAVVTVVGTAFSVTRDRLGTAIQVSRGEVSARCIGGPAQALHAGERSFCLPRRATGMLTRAQALLDLGATPEEVLDTLAQGLKLASDGDPAVGELLALRIEVLLELGRDAEAAADARQYLRAGGPRREEVEAVLRALGDHNP